MAVNSFPVSQSAGTRIYGPVAVPDDLTDVDFAFGNWPQANRLLAFTIQMSIDGGVSWSDGPVQNPTGGARSAPRGSTDCGISCRLPTGTNRQLRAVVTVTGGTVSSLLTVTTS